MACTEPEFPKPTPALRGSASHLNFKALDSDGFFVFFKLGFFSRTGERFC